MKNGRCRLRYQNTSWFVHHWFSLHSYFVSPSSSGVQAAAIAVVVRCFRSAYNNHLDVIVVIVLLDVTKRRLFRLPSPLSLCARACIHFYFFVVCSNILNALERTAENNKILVLFITKEKLSSFGRVSSFCVFGTVFGLAFFLFVTVRFRIVRDLDGFHVTNIDFNWINWVRFFGEWPSPAMLNCANWLYVCGCCFFFLFWVIVRMLLSDISECSRRFVTRLFKLLMADARNGF